MSTEYPRVRFARAAKGKLYSYAAPAGMCHVGDVVAVEANWVSCEGTLATVVELATQPPELPPGVTLKAVWRVIPPEQLPLFRPGR